MAVPAVSMKNLDRHFLGVERSLTGRAWRERLDGRGSARALAIAQRYGVDELLARIIAGRDVDVDQVDSFLDPTIKRLMPDPYTLTDMEAAATRLAEGKRRGVETVVIDHHQGDEKLPEAVAIVDPNRPDDLSGLGHLAAVGLVFLTLVAVARELRRRNFWSDLRPEPDLLSLLHLVA